MLTLFVSIAGVKYIYHKQHNSITKQLIFKVHRHLLHAKASQPDPRLHPAWVLEHTKRL
jgi:hypothetical protein